MFHIGFVYTMPTETYPIWTIHSHHQRGAASPRYRNRAKITVFMCQQKPFPARFSCPRKSCDPYDSVSIDLSYRKCRHYLYRTFFIFKRHGHNFLPSILPFIDGILKLNQLANETHARNQFAFNYFYCSFTF